MKGFEHHVGGLEKDITGNVSYVPENHDEMVRMRAEKVNKVGDFVTQPKLHGQSEGDMLIVSWGSTYGTVYNAIEEIEKRGQKVSWMHLKWINPLPKNLDAIIRNFKNVLVPEINLGQLIKILRAEYLVDAKGFNVVKGLPLNTGDLVEAIESYLKGSTNV